MIVPEQASLESESSAFGCQNWRFGLPNEAQANVVDYRINKSKTIKPPSPRPQPSSAGNDDFPTASYTPASSNPKNLFPKSKCLKIGTKAMSRKQPDTQL